MSKAINEAQMQSILSYAENNFQETIEQLSSYLAIPAISCEENHFTDVHKLATKIRDDLEKLGFQKSTVQHLEDTLPLVSAEYMHAGPDKPTLLIYGHLDLQPVAGEPWDTNPHEAVIKGDRLYARGSADDMGGWVSHMAAAKAWLETQQELPLNIKLIIEGEEEIGSPNLEQYMNTFPELFEADVMVLTDCENPSLEIPGLTTSLRGLYEVDLKVEALKSDVHSGLWGNMAPDVSTSLIKILARIIDEDGRLNIGRMNINKKWAKESWDVPLNDNIVRSGANVRDDVSVLPDHGKSPAEWLWRQPALTILSTTLPLPGSEKNALRTQASARLSIRLAPGQTKEEMQLLLEQQLLAIPCGGVKTTIIPQEGSASSWLYEPKGEAFAAVDRAYEKTWGRPMLQVGIGGSIPFVALFGRKFSNLPLILNGVMDPETGAHGPNESMHIPMFKKAIMANIHLYQELAETLKKNS